MAFLVLLTISDMVWGAIISAGASLLGGAMANRSRSSEADTNRDFQEEMSRTQYQRAMEDMRQAGLNPMLAFSQEVMLCRQVQCRR